MNFWSFVTTGILGNIFASQVVRSTTFGPPDFVSDWFTIKANKKVFPALEVRHNLSEIPAIVEVQVKSTESPNNNYIFPAIGIGQRDDDMPVDYGGVIYIYNAEYIRIQTPIAYNNIGVGSVIYTGGSPYWTGPNYQKSMQASVRVRAWRGLSLPLPGYHEDNITIDARSTDSSKVYIEKTHGLRNPVYVKTRIHLTNGQYAGWVTDTLGSTMIAYSVQEWWYRTIGVISAYDDSSVRVWVHSNQQVGVIFSTEDGWGSPYHMNPTTTGRVEIFAWNDFGYPPLIKTSYDIGPGVTNEQLEFPINKMTVDELFFDVMVEAKQGTNKGFRFRGVGSAMTNTWNLNSVCGYGGLIYAYNNQSIRLWRPSSGHGGYTACIGSIFGNGRNSLAQENVRVVITVWTLFPLNPSRSNAVTDQTLTTPERPITTYDDSSDFHSRSASYCLCVYVSPGGGLGSELDATCPVSLGRYGSRLL